MKHCRITAALVVCYGLLTAELAFSASRKIENRDAAQAAVQQALREEVVSVIDRRELLGDALSQDPQSDVLRWQSGFVREGKMWRSYDEPVSSAEQSRLNRYRERREQLQQSNGGQRELADWCHQHGYPEQERAHLLNLIHLVPELDWSKILERLEYSRVGNQWLNGRQLQDWADTNERSAAALKRWSPQLQKIAEKLQGTKRQRDAARAELAVLNDADAISAMEYALCGRDESSALFAIEVFSGMPDVEATTALARQAVFSPWPAARTQAAGLLKNRKFEEFVPGLISLLASPAERRMSEVRWGWEGNRGLVLLYSYVVARETENQFEAVTLSNVDFSLREELRYYQTILGINSRKKTVLPEIKGNTSVNWFRVKNDLSRSFAADAYRQQKQIAAVNERTEELNRRVTNVLASISDLPPTTEFREWWSWWDTYVDIDPPKQKRVVRVSEVDYRGDPSVINPMPIRISRCKTCCFAAGTPVWTQGGPVAIEQVSVGDLVLAKDTETGELAYKAVVSNTVRPPRELLKLRFGGISITTTGGHRFWLSGEGWMKARDLQPGALLHTVAGNCSLTAVEPSLAAQTYNLVVDDFHSYFVGQVGLLVQDLPLPNSTNSVVPGLKRRELAVKAQP